MGHTKGEWEVRTYVAPVFGNQAALTCREIWAGERRVASSINEANAQLISMAPRMYEACVEICRRYDEDGILDISPARKALEVDSKT